MEENENEIKHRQKRPQYKSTTTDCAPVFYIYEPLFNRVNKKDFQKMKFQNIKPVTV